MDRNLDFEEMLELFEITDKDLDAIRLMQKEASIKLPELIEKWYVWLEQTPEYKIYFSDKVTQERVLSLQLKHWERFFEGRLDMNYMEGSKRVGAIHAKIGLPQDLYLAGMDHFLGLLVGMLRDMEIGVEKTNECRRALNKICHLDMCLTVQSYEKVVNDKIRA